MFLRKRDLPLIRFLEECNNFEMDKKVLDCGAGGGSPPLAIFYKNGYETHGIDISSTRIDRALEFANSNKMDLKIVQGDIRKLPYEKNSFCFVYSHHTIHHMRKIDTKLALSEMIRVLCPGGVLFVNVPSFDSEAYRTGVEVAKGEFQEIYSGKVVIHSTFVDDELEGYVSNLEILLKQKRNYKRTVMLDYIMRKEE